MHKFIKIKRLKDKIFYFFSETGYSKNRLVPIIFATIHNVTIVQFVWKCHPKVLDFVEFIANFFFLMYVYLSLYVLYDISILSTYLLKV